MARLNSLTLTLIDAPDGAVGYEVEHYTPPKFPFTAAESLMMHLLYTIEQVSESSDEACGDEEGEVDHTENETNNGDAPESLCTGLQRDVPSGDARVGGTNVVPLQSRTERSRGTLDT